MLANNDRASLVSESLFFAPPFFSGTRQSLLLRLKAIVILVLAELLTKSANADCSS